MKHLRNFLVGFAMFAAGAAGAAGLGFFGTPTGIVSGPQDPSQLYTYLNSLLLSLNGQVFNYLAFNQASETGNVALTQSGSWAANGSVATSVTSVGPTGAHTTVQEWVVFVDNNGYVRYVPAF